MSAAPRSWGRLLALLAVAMAVPVVWAVTPVGAWALGAVDALRGSGPAGMLIFGAMVTLSGPMILSAELVMAASGFLFGATWGFLVAWVFMHGAALANLLLARTVLRARVASALDGGAVLAVQDLLEHRGVLIVALLRLPPLSPFHVVSYALGLTRVRVRDAMLGTTIGSIPQVALFAWIGSQVGDVSSLAHANAGIGAPMWAAIAVATVVVTGALTVLARRALDRLAAEGRIPPEAP